MPHTESTNTTPSSRWNQESRSDPHGERYDCQRSELPMGDMTDDELANAVFMYGDKVPSFEDLIAGNAKMPIAYLTAAKERIRWLSRALEKSKASEAKGDQ
tara:strand:+ start:250 stop:552 length:303 start_codon:yes stop_codon:yes gene_type:complete